MEDSPNWIEKFKRISWEPEILISGGILFSLFQAKSALVVVHNQFYPLALHGFKIILLFFTLSISALTVGFTLHLITKSFWIALLALKSVFPKGINNKRIKYSENFWERAAIDLTLNTKISKVGNASSLLFTISFLALFIVLGILVYFIIWLIIGSFIYDILPFPMEILMVALLILPLIDFITFGALKKSSSISKLYYPNYKLVSYITLSFLYREILYTFISNIPKKNISLFSLLFMTLSIFLTFWNSADFMIRQTSSNNWGFYNPTFSTLLNERFYENLRKPSDQVAIATIQSDVIKDNHIKLYVRYVNSMDWELDSLAKSNLGYSTNEVLNKYIYVNIDEKKIDSVSWFFTKKQDINQPGLVGYMSINNLTRGAHQISISTITSNQLYTIPFWKD